MGRRSVALQRQATGVNAYGEPIGTWSTVKNLGAYISALSLTESTAINREITTSVLVFEFSKSPTSEGMTTDDRLVYRGSNFYVLSVDALPTRSDVRVVAEARS